MKKVLFILIVSFYLLPSSVFAQSVDLLWHGDTYTPPFYSGAPLWSNQSFINMVAIPQGFSNPGSLNYKWIKNGTVLGSLSGVGRNSLKIQDSIFSKPQSVKVEIVSGEGEVLAENTIYIKPVKPSILVYEDNPLYGFMFNLEASNNYVLQEEEVTFGAFPLFYSAFSKEDFALKYTWRSNAREDSNTSSVTYRVPEETSGASSILVRIENTETLTQTGERSFLIQFGNKE